MQTTTHHPCPAARRDGGETMSNQCTKCNSKDNYNFAIDNGLCNSCIAEKLEQQQSVVLGQAAPLQGQELLDACIFTECKGKQLQAELATAKEEIQRLLAVARLALVLDDVESIKNVLQPWKGE